MQLKPVLQYVEWAEQTATMKVMQLQMNLRGSDSGLLAAQGWKFYIVQWSSMTCTKETWSMHKVYIHVHSLGTVAIIPTTENCKRRQEGSSRDI